MKNRCKTILKTVLICILLTFSGCEKELYEEQIKSEKGKINYVTINEVPFLLPSIQKFNNDYKFLSYPNQTLNKDELNLNLDLDHILEYVKENGLKTYSIVIKEDFTEYENKYFENLHIFEKDGVYENVILKYDAIDDYEKFDPKTFTGDVEVYDINYVYQGVIQYENGVQKCIKMAVGCINVWWFTNLGEIWIWYECGATGGGSDTGGATPAGTEPADSPGSSGSTSGGSGSTTGGNTGSPTSNDPTLAEHYPVIANVPVWPDPEGATSLEMAGLLAIELELDSDYRIWLKNSPLTTPEIYSYLFDALYLDNNSNNDAIEKAFTREVIIRMKQNPTLFTSMKPFLIEKGINDSQLDPCSKGVFQNIKNTTNCDFAQIFAKLGADGSIYTTTLKTAHNNYTSNGITLEVADPANTVRTTPGVKYDYTMYVNPDYSGKTKLFIAALLLHEMAHTYFFSAADDFNTGATNSFNELPILFNAAVVKKFPINSNLHHEEIANTYIYAISSALKEYQPGLPQQVYDDLAKGGLYKTPIFDTLFPPGSPDRDRIINRYAAEQTGTSQGQGADQQNPLGQPCGN